MAKKIAGDILEGGGQILRIAVCLSSLTGKAVNITNIRGKRRQPGLAAQHLNGVQLVQQLCNATVDGATLKSTELLFMPGSIRSGHFSADTKTAGSIALLLQVALPCCLYGDDRSGLTLKGGTNADMAPQIEYTTRVLFPTLRLFGISISHEIKMRGFFPAGNGHAYFEIEPLRELKSISLIDYGELCEITGEAFHAGKFLKSVADKMAVTAQNILKSKVKVPVRIQVKSLTADEAFGCGFGLNLVARTSTGCLLGSSQIGRPNVPAEQIARTATDELLNDMRNRVCVDQHLQDQLIVFMALAAGVSSVRTGSITLHTKTAMHIVKQLTNATFTITPDGETNVIKCSGIGLTNSNPLS